MLRETSNGRRNITLALLYFTSGVGGESGRLWESKTVCTAIFKSQDWHFRHPRCSISALMNWNFKKRMHGGDEIRETRKKGTPIRRPRTDRDESMCILWCSEITEKSRSALSPSSADLRQVFFLVCNTEHEETWNAIPQKQSAQQSWKSYFLGTRQRTG